MIKNNKENILEIKKWKKYIWKLMNKIYENEKNDKENEREKKRKREKKWVVRKKISSEVRK